MKMIKYVMLVPFLLMPLIGYFWPHSAEVEDEFGILTRWSVPELSLSTPAEPDYELLARVWPVDISGIATEAESTAAGTRPPGEWSLVAIISEGEQRLALVMTPDQDILTLSAGMALDESRKIRKIGSTYIEWSNENEEAGTLQLYPAPATDDNN